MKSKYYNKEIEQAIIDACKTHVTMINACASLQMNYNTFIKHAKRLKCYAPNPGKHPKSCKGIYKTNLKEILQGKVLCKSSTLKLRLFNAGIKEKECEVCHNTIWNNKPIPLELHHIDGNHSNNKLENLQILCPNCHAQTDNYGSKNKKVPRIITVKYIIPTTSSMITKCKICNKPITVRTKTGMCQTCYRKSTRKAKRPIKSVLEKEIKTLGYCGTGRKYGVSDNAIRKWLN